MDRSLYPEGVEIRQSDLNNTEESRSFHILKRHINNTSPGVVSGLLVTIDPSQSTLITIAAGFGYTPSGELVQLPSGVSGVQLSSYTSGIKNYILLVYTETNDDARSHETSGESLPTKANRSYRIEVLTESAYNALPQTDDNLDNTDKDRSLIVAIVTAQGSGIALLSSNIELPTTFSGGISAVAVGSGISGVQILRIDNTTITGTGTLSFNVGTLELTWQAPGDSSGTPVDISAGGAFTLTSLPSGVTLTVLVFDTQLPTSNASTSISVTNIYTQDVTRHTSTDYQHRSFIGTGVPTTTNPHGLTPDDLGLGETQVEFHQEVFHSNGIDRDSNSNVLEPIVNTGGIPHTLDFTAPLSGDKFFLGGFLHTALNGTTLQFTDIADDAQILFDTYAVLGTNNTATLEKRERIRYDDTPPPTLSTVVQLYDVSEVTPAGAGTILWDNTVFELFFTAPGDSTGSGVSRPSTDRTIRLYSGNTDYYIDVFVRASGSWPVIANVTENITISTLPTPEELANRLKLSSTMFSGSGTGFLGVGFGAANSPNDPNDQRLFGMTSVNDLRDDVFDIFKVNLLKLQNHTVALPQAPSNDPGYLTSYNSNLYFWNGSNWDLIS